MKLLISAAFVALLSMGATGVSGTVTPAPVVKDDVAEHGGGCRKSSPAGQCCHMDNRTGSVHCH